MEEVQYVQESPQTVKKLQVASWASAVSMVALYLLKTYVFVTTPLPGVIEMSLGLVISGAVGWFVTWASGYFTPPRGTDGVIVKTKVPKTNKPNPA